MRRFTMLIMGLVCAMSFSAHAQQSEKKVRYNYLTYLPSDYDSLKRKAYPVIIYLHGLSISGNDINKVRRQGLPFFLERGKKLNFLVIAPQCPRGKNWASENWMDTIFSEINAKYTIDNERIYLTGMSLGGFGTWELANRYPYRFAAIAPLCGGGRVEWIDNLRNTPAWVFHGDKDVQVPVSRSDIMVKELEKTESVVVYSRLNGQGHSIYKVYDDFNIYDWFLKYTARDPEKKEEIGLIKPVHVAKNELLKYKTTIYTPIKRNTF